MDICAITTKYIFFTFLNNKFMHIFKETIQEKSYDIPKSIHTPELLLIIERLQDVVNRYDGIVYETGSKLQMIKKYEEPSTRNEAVKTPHEIITEQQPESATEEIYRLLFRLNDLNEEAERNLRHLKEII